MREEEDRLSTFVLIHGAWHGGWCWQKVTPLLRAAGHDVYAPSLTGLGDRVHLASPTVDLTTHIQDVTNVLDYEDLRDVVLVGHSYGGMVIAGVTERAAHRLAHLVFLDAAVPTDGEALIDSFNPTERRDTEEKVRAHGAGWQLPLDLPAALADFGIVDPTDQTWLAARLTPHPFKTITAPVQLTNPAARAIPRTFIWCTGTPLAGAFGQMVTRLRQPGSGYRFREIATGHDAMVTAPRALADLLLEAT